ncbi:MAG TPA: FAD-binding and (Fe-S)-binding domain-containing protein [Anaerolineales bacterium]|nr:FAD-binding and (Fe-S)-binding domain-containing protein [Anaerolineales bacterium]
MDLQTSLSQIIHPERVFTSPLYRIAYANDASYFRLIPQAVVQPNSIGEIQALFKFTQQHRIPMTFRAAGTSLSGQAVTDGILVDISKHWGKYNIEDHGKLIRFQPGIIGGFLNQVLKPYGRRIGPDPASIDACMMGGILANNSSGMCCGVTENAYRTLHSMTFVLPNGFVLDTASPNAHQIFEHEQPHLAKGLLELKRKIIEAPSPTLLSEKRRGEGESLAQRIRRRYQMKNNNGYLLNAFLDFETPLDILVHLLIGSEGTLGFIAEGVLHTLPDYPYRYTGQLYFKNIQDAADAIYPLKQSGARAVEIMDRPSLRSIENLPGAPALLAQLPETAAAILVEYQGQSREDILTFRAAAAHIISEIKLIHDPEFTEDPTRQAILWKLRKGIIPSVGAMRPTDTILLTEDIVFPVQSLAEGVTDLQHLFANHGYQEGVIFGHAKDGNLHFLIAQSFNTDSEVHRFAAFMDDLVRVVSGKYDGALKAEHGTGRNTAPFVETEWGAEAYAIMREIKSLLDPDNMLNPGVIINPDPQAHIQHVKSIAQVSPEVDKCIECGFCESRCPSRFLTLTPRQRIVVQRELSRLRLAASSSPLLDSVIKDFSYAGLDTCAVDGLCATACPVNINTGDLTRSLRAASVTRRGERISLWLANHFAIAEKFIGIGVLLGHLAQKAIGMKGINFAIRAAEKITNTTLPKWNSAIPHPTRLIRLHPPQRHEVHFIYFPSCVSRRLGTPNHGFPLPTALQVITQRAGIHLHIPENVSGHCCGMPFHSKGYVQACKVILHKTLRELWNWSEQGKYPIVIDTSSCTHALLTNRHILDEEDQAIQQKLILLDVVEFLHDHVLPKLELHPISEEVILHPNCSLQKLGLQDKLVGIAKRCARSAVVPLTLGCCGFAGDRGLLFPALTTSATQKEAAEVNARKYGGYYSSNIPCEIGMSAASGQEYISIVYLVERASRGEGV